MTHAEKSAYYNELKTAGVQLDRTYQQYTTDELRSAVVRLRELRGEGVTFEPQPEHTPSLPPFLEPDAKPQPQPTMSLPPVQPAPRDEMAGMRLNTQAADEPIRTDEKGRIWYQEEVRKPGFPKPRGRRVLKYLDSGSKTQTVQNGEYIETFEVAGDVARQAEVKVTLPSYQVGIYKDPRFPFKIHVYNENRGFDYFEVQAFYGGAELVPTEIKRRYVENDLCYDIPTTVRAINTEYRERVLGQMKGL